ncbi:MAG: dihydroorotase [Cyclobacteriaceae bacterium]
MNLTFRSATLLDPRSKFHNKQADISIKNGVIDQIGKNVKTIGKEIDAKGQYISPGWFDLNCLFGDPGHEHKEDRITGAQAAAAGGFTGIAHLPNTNPVIESKNDIAYLKAFNGNQVTDIHPIVAVTKGCLGDDLTEMIDLHQAGAIAFSDGVETIWNSDILLKTLQYLQKFDGLLMNRSEDRTLNQFGTMNEGVQSTILGMKGMPNLAEELAIARDLRILAYTGGKIHFSTISTAESVKLIRKAKKQGLNVTCDVAAHNLILDDSLIEDFDANLKVNPPLRTKKDIAALIKGLEDETIDAIVSAHNPQDEEGKKLEFDLAEFGHIGLQAVLPILVSISDKLPLEVTIPKLTSSPRRILKLEPATISVGQPANLTLFDPKAQWILDDSSNKSKSRNSWYFGKQLKGKVVATVNGKNTYFADQY